MTDRRPYAGKDREWPEWNDRAIAKIPGAKTPKAPPRQREIPKTVDLFGVPIMTDAPKIPHVAWRRGRPRFEPSKTLRELGYTGMDLKQPDGEWMTAGQALDWSRDFARKLAQARRAAPTQKRKPSAASTIAALVPSYPLKRLWADWTNVSLNPAAADWSAKTLYEYRQNGKTIATYLPEAWEAEAAALTKAICLGMYDRLRTGPGLSTASAVMRRLGTALQWAIDRDKLPGMAVNPAHRLRMKTPPPRIRYATKEEIAQLVAVADEIGRPELADMIVLAVWSGQRQNDRLQFQLAGRSNGRITLRQMKTKKIVSMPEAPQLKARLTASEARRKVAEVINPLVILDEKHWIRFLPSHYAHQFAKLRAAAAKGLPAKEGRPAIDPMKSLLTLRDQDLRDTAVTWLGMAGCTIPEICAITGHSLLSAYTILRHYLDINQEMADSAMGKMVAWFDAPIADENE